MYVRSRLRILEKEDDRIAEYIITYRKKKPSWPHIWGLNWGSLR